MPYYQSSSPRLYKAELVGSNIESVNIASETGIGLLGTIGPIIYKLDHTDG